MITDIAAAFACFLATLLAMTALRPVAVAVQLVDKPGGRKTHRGDIPIVGGIAMFIGCTFGIGLMPSNQLISASLMSAASLVVLVGLLDDRFEISPAARLAAHLMAALIVLGTNSDLAIISLGAPFGSSGIRFSEYGSTAFTCVAIMGAINAFNMLDGMDGLAGTMAFNALIALSVLGSLSSDPAVTGVSLVLAGAVSAFLIFNMPARFNRRFRCFMGDAGSTLLGFLLACLCIAVSQGNGALVSPTTTLWLVALPLFELLWTTIRRVLKGHSPFRPDRGHFHHKLIDAGFSIRGAFFVLICIGILLASTGVLIHHFDVSDSLSFGSWLLAGMSTVVLMNRTSALRRLIPRRLLRMTAETNAE